MNRSIRVGCYTRVFRVDSWSFMCSECIFDPMKGVCKLCDSHAELQNSHILPAFIWRIVKQSESGQYIYHEQHDQKHVGRKQQTEYRERLLCYTCEQHIARAERHVGRFANAWVNAPILDERGKFQESPVSCQGVDIDRMRNLLYATFWRMSVASVEYFADFRLPSDVENRLKEKVQAADPGDPFEFPLVAYMDKNLYFKPYFAYPTLGPDDYDRWFIEFVCLGFAWRLYYDFQDLGPMAALALGQDGAFRYSVFDFTEHKLATARRDAITSANFRNSAKLPPLPPTQGTPERSTLEKLYLPPDPEDYRQIFLKNPLGGEYLVFLALYARRMPGQLRRHYQVAVAEPHRRATLLPLDIARNWFPGEIEDWYLLSVGRT